MEDFPDDSDEAGLRDFFIDVELVQGRGDPAQVCQEVVRCDPVFVINYVPVRIGALRLLGNDPGKDPIAKNLHTVSMSTIDLGVVHVQIALQQVLEFGVKSGPNRPREAGIKRLIGREVIITGEDCDLCCGLGPSGNCEGKGAIESARSLGFGREGFRPGRKRSGHDVVKEFDCVEELIRLSLIRC